MAYFGKSHSHVSIARVEPRTIFLTIWITVCAVVMALLLKNAFQPAPVPVAVAAPAPVIVNQNVVPVLIPVEQIALGTRLTSDLFVMKERNISGMQDKVVTSMAQAIGSYAAETLQKDSPVMKDAISTTLPTNAVTSKIPEGFRAVTISVNAESGVEGWVRPGVSVDVVWISQVKAKQIVSVIVEDAKVLSAERSTDVNGNEGSKAIPSHVTLLASASDAQRIQLAKSSGTLSLNLRGSADQASQGANTITIDGLVNKDMNPKEIDSAGWVEVGGKKFDVSHRGKLRKSDDTDTSVK